MNENQLQELYNRISAADATYSKRYTFDQFKANMQDQAYVGKLSSWASSRGIDIPTEQPSVQQPPVQQRPVANAYNAEDLLKKKSIQSVSSSDQSSLASTSEQNEEEPKPLYNVDPKRYETKLPQSKEQEFQKWLDSQVKLGRISQGDYDFYKRNGYGYNYDFRAAFLNKDSGGISPVDNQWHWGDYGKKPNHPTFSVESVYNMRDGLQGGVWGGKEGEDFMAPFKPQPAVSEGTRAGVPPIQQQQKVQQQIQQREQKRNLPQFVTEQVEGVTPELMSKEEEFVVPQLNYKFGPLGFKFEESGITNNVTVTAPNGKKKDIPIPTNLYQDLTTGNPVLSILGKLFGYEEGLEKEGAEPASELKMFIRENAQNIKDLAKYESMYRGEKVKYDTDKQAKEALQSASSEANAMINKVKTYTAMSQQADKIFEELNKVPENKRDAAYQQRFKEAVDMKQQAIANAPSDEDRAIAEMKYKQVEKATGEYFAMKGEQGTWLGALTRGELKGTGSLLAGAVDLGVMAGNVAMYPYMAGQPEMVRQRDELRRGITNFFVDNFGDKSTTEQWTAAMSEKNVANAAVLGLGSMAPALAAGAIAGPIAGGAVFAAQGYNDTMIEAEEAGIPPGERELVAVPVGITMGVVSELGLSKVPGVKQFANKVTAKAMGALGADFTATTFRNFVENEVKSSIARGALVAGKGFVHGFETGVKMEAGTIGIKELYNQVKDRKDEDGNYMKSFNTPESIGDFFSHLVESGISMGIGGAILGSPEVIKSAASKNNFNGISDVELNMFDALSKDDNFMALTTLGIKSKILKGELTKEQGQLTLDSYQQLASLMKSLPEGLTNAQKRKALGLLQEKVLLKSQIEGKDPSLTKKQRDRVTEIDNFLGQISEGKYSEVSEIKPEDVKVTIGDKVMWNPDAAKEMEQWDVAEVKDDSVILTKGEEKQTIPLKELQQHITDTYAVQKSIADESVLRAEQPEMGLQEVVEGDQKSQIVTLEEEPKEEGLKSEMSDNQNQTKIDLPNIIETSQSGLGHAKDIGGTAYQLEGGVGIIQGFNLFGEPTYIPYKEGVGRARTDIDNYKGDAFTQEEISNLKQLKNDLVSKEKENEANAGNPFEKQGRVASTDNVSSNLKDFVKNLTDKLGVDKKIFIITDADLNEGQYKKHGLYGKLSAVRSAKLASENKLEFGHKRYMPDADAYYIYYDGKLSGTQLFTILSHELGHIIEQDKFKSASEETKNAIKQDWANWYSNLTGKTVSEVINETRDITIQDLFSSNTKEFDPSVHKYISSFSEYFADNVSKWTRSSEKPKTLVDKFFYDLAESFKKVFDYVFKTGNYSKNIFSWLDEMYQTGGKEKISPEKKTTTAKEELSLAMAEGTKKRIELEQKGVPKEEIASHPEYKPLLEKINNALKRTKEEKEAGAIQPMKEEDITSHPDYETVMREIQDYADFATNKKEYWSEEVESRTKSYNKYKESERYRKGSLTEQRLKEDIQEAKNELKKYTEGNFEKAMEILENSETYKSADDIQKESLVRDLRSRFELKEKKAPKPEELFGDVADVNKAMEEIKFEFEDAEKSKIYLEGEYEKAKAAYDKSVKEGKPSAPLKRNMDKAKAEIEEYKTKNIEAAKKALRKTETYKKASPERQQKMEKYLEDRFLRRKEVLPTKLFEGAKEGGKVTTTNKRIWAEKLKSYFNGIKSHANALAETRNAIKESINDLAKGGKITAKQAATLIERASKVKIFNEESITKFVDYASKLFADADYASKLNDAKALRKSVSKLSRNKETNLDLKEMGERFAEIDPSMVDNIDLYNENATKIADAMKASLGRKLGETVVIEKMSDYVKETMDAQIEKMTEIKQKQLEELGIDATDMSYSQIVELMKALKEEKPLNDEQEKAARDIAKRQFEMNAAIINEMIESGKDPFTGDDIEFTDTQKRLVKEFMDMNLSYLSVKEANAAAAALDNFITNGSTAKMSVMADRYKGLVETKELYDKGVRAKSLKSIMLLGLFPKTLGRIWAEKIGSVTNVIDRQFRSPGIAAELSKVIGLTDVINGHAKGVRVAQDRIKAYLDKFNKGDFNTAENDVERGMYADLLRSTEGTPEQIAAEFNAKKEDIKEDIEKLKESKDDDLIKKGELYQKVYDKIVKDSNNAQEVKSKMNQKNAEAIDWWVNEWGNHFGSLSELLESVYNRRLGKDLNYTPRTIKYIKSKPREIGEIESVFMANRGGIYTGETGVIMEATKNKPPRDMYVDYSFNKNMSESLYDAMIDINTASKVARLKSAVDSPFFQAMFEGSKDYDVLRNVISSYVRDMRHKTIYDQSELSSGIRAMNNIATLGVNMSLSGVTQPVKQIVPILGNTMTNAGIGNTMNAIGAMFKGGLEFVNNSGRDIAVRGQESMVNIKDVNSMLKNASESFGAKSIDAIENANKAMLKYTLKLPDVLVAKASWLAYYEKYLRDSKLYETEAMKMTENESKLLEKYNKIAEEILNDPNEGQIHVDWAKRWKENPLIEQRESVKFWEREYELDPSESNKNALSESKERYSALLKSRGIQVGKLSIDYTTHKLNEKAADYADSQVRRQQNVSLRELQGGMFKSQNTFEKLFVQTLMPFANFRMNQKSRMGNDIFTIFSDVATKQERLDAARSLRGTAVEAVMFNGLRIAIGYGLWQAANALIGNEPTEEQEDKYMNTMIKSSATGVVNDFFSPLPPFDPATSYGANTLFDITQDLADIEDKDKLNVFDGMSKQDITKAFGLLGVVPSRIGQTAEAINLWSTGDFKDDFGRVKKLNDESRDAMGDMALISLLSLSGLGLAETNTIVKDAIKIIKKGAKVESKLTPQEQKEKAEGKKERQETKKEKIKSINVLIDQQNDPDVIRELLKIRRELEKGMDKKERRNEKKKMEELLQGYDSKSDMKRYDPDLYERTFGEGTKYYMENRGEIEAEKKLREYMREQEDIERNYTPKPKRQKLRFENKRTLRFRRTGP